MSLPLRRTLEWLWASCAIICASVPAMGATLYVSTSSVDQTLTNRPFTTLCSAVLGAKDGDTIVVAEGTYNVTDVCEVGRHQLTIMGGYRIDFKTRDAFVNVSHFVVANKGFLSLLPNVDQLTIDGVLIDGGGSSQFGAALGCNDCLTTVYANDQPALMDGRQMGSLTLKNVVIVNAPNGAIRATVRGRVTLDNVGLVNTRGFGVDVTGVCGYASPQCAELVVKNSTLIWTWRNGAAADSLGGSAIKIGAGVKANVAQSVIAYADRVAIELGDKPNELGLDDDVVFDNHLGDVGVSHDGQWTAAPIGLVSEAVGVSGTGPYGHMERLALPWDLDYLSRYLARASNSFYAGRFNSSRAFLLSPTPSVGLGPPPGSRLTYAALIKGPASQPVDAAKTTEPTKKKSKRNKRGRSK